MLYPAELRGRHGADTVSAARNQFTWVGGTTGSGSGATGTPSSASALASASVACPWTCSGATSPECIARAVSVNWSPTQRDPLSSSACTSASLASGETDDLRGTLGAIGAFATRVDAQNGQLASLQAVADRNGQLETVAQVTVLAMNQNQAAAPADKFVVKDTLTEDGRVGKVTESQGVVSLRPMNALRWTPVVHNPVLKPGDSS